MIECKICKNDIGLMGHRLIGHPDYKNNPVLCNKCFKRITGFQGVIG